MTNTAIRSGIDLSHVDDSIRPQDDLFGHVNGRWLAEYEIPADRAQRFSACCPWPRWCSPP
ncbi:hypothetical protein MOKP64_50920 [Mycobacterium avium subsp. hominissuis]